MDLGSGGWLRVPAVLRFSVGDRRADGFSDRCAAHTLADAQLVAEGPEQIAAPQAVSFDDGVAVRLAVTRRGCRSALRATGGDGGSLEPSGAAGPAYAPSTEQVFEREARVATKQSPLLFLEVGSWGPVPAGNAGALFFYPQKQLSHQEPFANPLFPPSGKHVSLTSTTPFGMRGTAQPLGLVC